MNKVAVVGLVAFATACGAAPSSSDVSTDQPEVIEEVGYQTRYACSCVAGPCTDDFRSASLFFKTSEPHRLHIKTYFDFKESAGRLYPEGQVDLEGQLDDAASTEESLSFTQLASFDAWRKTPLDAPAKAADLVGGTARIDRAMRSTGTGTFEGVPPEGSPDRVEGSFDLRPAAGGESLSYQCVISAQYKE